MLPLRSSDDAVGERAADVDADEETSHSVPPVLHNPMMDTSTHQENVAPAQAGAQVSIRFPFQEPTLDPGLRRDDTA